ncbi:MAG TPA: hypothetical protein VMS73_01875 [Anaerolineaceae bacterium]|nr:hypothetical protein [Anaerolineaceae bacterium]
MGLQLPAEIILTLEKRTDGWVTALQIAALSLSQQPDPISLLSSLKGGAHYLVYFLAEEVLDRQPEEVRQFLLRSSVLETLSGPLWEAVVNPEAQPGYGNVMLHRLEHARLFITSLDEQHELFIERGVGSAVSRSRTVSSGDIEDRDFGAAGAGN